MRVHPGFPPPYLVLLQLRFSKSWCLHPIGELLPHLFTLTGYPAVYFSVALSSSFPEPSLSANLLCEVPTFLGGFPTRSPTKPMCSTAMLPDNKSYLQRRKNVSSYAPKGPAPLLPPISRFDHILCTSRLHHLAKPAPLSEEKVP